MAPNKSETIWTRTFVLLCMTQFMGYAHSSLLTPTLPLYVTQLGGSAFLYGVILAAFSVTSVFLRPLIGSWGDSWSFGGILSAGGLLMGLSVLLFFFPLVQVLIVANAFRGIGWAAHNTGGYSLLAKSAPHNRRGEAAGFYGSIQSIPHSLFPALALWIMEAPLGGIGVVIGLSATLGFVGSAMALILKQSTDRVPSIGEPSIEVRQGHPRLFTAVDRGVMIASTLLLCLHISTPVTSGFTVLFAREVGIEGMGWYFLAGGLTQVLTRPTLGLLSDKIGRGRSVAAALVMELVGLLLLSVASNLTFLVIGVMFYAAGSAMGTATTMAMAIALADPQRRGAVMATYSTALPMSMGIGALLAGAIVEIAGFRWMFVSAMTMVAMGLLIAKLNWSRLDPPTP